MYLLDTNVWLERMLEQVRSDEVDRLLSSVPSDELLITDFSFHSIGVILDRLNHLGQLLRFVRDLFGAGSVELVTLDPHDMEQLVEVAEAFGLDFDDAYQYVAAEKYDAELVTFDSDFDATGRGRLTPADAVEAYQSS
jgi:predicted nucleic acid-binding protein